jgi:hypothetical protein
MNNTGVGIMERRQSIGDSGSITDGVV